MLEQQTNTLRQQIEALLRNYPDIAQDEILRADMLEGETDIKELVTEIHRMMEDAKGMRDGMQGRLDDLLTRRTRFQHRIDFGRDLIFAILDAAQMRKLELPEVTVSLRNNPPQLIGDTTADYLDDAYVKITRSVDRKAIREALEAGRAVDGYTLSNAPPSLMVKVK